MSDKKRFFYVVCNISGGQVTTSAVCRADGSMLNNNEVRQQVAKDARTHIDNVFIANWVEFDSEQDYEEFFR